MVSSTSFVLLASLALMLCANSVCGVEYYKALLSNENTVPKPRGGTETGIAIVALLSETQALGNFTVSKMKGAFMAHIHMGSATENGPALVWAFNSSLGGMRMPIDIVEFSTNFTFDPSEYNITGLLSTFNAYFNVHSDKNVRTIAYGRIRGQFEKCSAGGCDC